MQSNVRPVLKPRSMGASRSMDHEPTDFEIDEVLRLYACKKCFGRGYVGWRSNGDPVMCQCVERARKRVPLEAKRLETT